MRHRPKQQPGCKATPPAGDTVSAETNLLRRLFLLSEDGRRRPVKRSTERVDLGRPHQLARRLISISERHGVDVEHDPVYGRARAWVRPRAKGWPMAKELSATAPARVIDKQDKHFEQHWEPLVSGSAAQLPLV